MGKKLDAAEIAREALRVWNNTSPEDRKTFATLIELAFPGQMAALAKKMAPTLDIPHCEMHSSARVGLLRPDET